VYREYEAIKNKHDVQSRVMEDAMKSASQVTFQAVSVASFEISIGRIIEMSIGRINEGSEG
jgi:hypothetical protein